MYYQSLQARGQKESKIRKQDLLLGFNHLSKVVRGMLLVSCFGSWWWICWQSDSIPLIPCGALKLYLQKRYHSLRNILVQSHSHPLPISTTSWSLYPSQCHTRGHQSWHSNLLGYYSAWLLAHLLEYTLHHNQIGLETNCIPNQKPQQTTSDEMIF